MSGYEHDAVHIALDQRLDQVVLEIAVLTANPQQWHSPAAGQSVLKPGGELGKVRVRDVGQHHSDGVTVLGAQRCRGAVVDVSQLRHGLADPVPRLCGDQRTVVQHQAHRCSGDVAVPGDVHERYTSQVAHLPGYLDRSNRL